MSREAAAECTGMVGNRTLTDIYIGKYSLPMILAIWDSKDFLSAWEVMTELAEGEIETAEMRIWNMRR